MQSYLVAIWRRPRIKGQGPLKYDHGDCDMFFDESELIRQIEDYGIEPDSIVQMVSEDGRHFTPHDYPIDMNQVRKDAMADAWQMRPRFGV